MSMSDTPEGQPRSKRKRSSSPTLIEFLPDASTQPTKRPRNSDSGQDPNEIIVSAIRSATRTMFAEDQAEGVHPGFITGVENLVNSLRVSKTTTDETTATEELKSLIQRFNTSIMNLAQEAHASKTFLLKIEELKRALERMNLYDDTNVNTDLHPSVDDGSTGVTLVLKRAFQYTLQRDIVTDIDAEMGQNQLSLAPNCSTAATVDDSATNIVISSPFGTSGQKLVSDPSTLADDIGRLDLSTRVIIGQIINCGGYSDIFQGDLGLDDKQIQVAIKALRVQGYIEKTAIEERLRKRFYREVLLWDRLHHSNVVPLLGYIILPHGFPALISPWYVNGNVIRYLQSHPTSDRLALALDVIRGLEYLHSIEIMHGDLKGENILVDADGRASLCDFGMSQFVDEASRISGFTTTHAYVGGTDRFMSPELLEDQPKTPAADIWALGCVITQILSDETPYQNVARKQAVFLAIVKGDPPMTNTSGVIVEPLWSCIKKCWSAIPNDRPNASEVGQQVMQEHHVQQLQKQNAGIIPYVQPALGGQDQLPSPSEPITEASVDSPPTSPGRTSRNVDGKDIPKEWVYPLPLTLEQLFRGGSHEFAVTRYMLDRTTQKERIRVEVQPGWKPGTRILFPDAGNQIADKIFQDVVFVVEQIQHPRFARLDGGRLALNLDITFADALKGEGRTPRHIKCLDGTTIEFHLPPGVIKSGMQTILRGKGMPIRSKSKVVGRGDLIIKWNVVADEASPNQIDAMQRIVHDP
ncbi:hypothetical protein FRC03_000711 [Tulasnella sp. 419]|nr:hypothetical protein FRC03_000711 [Tulasnella sp. 419]